MLYEAKRYETLMAGAWNEQAALACINENSQRHRRQILGSRPLAFSSARQFLAGRPLGHGLGRAARLSCRLASPSN